MDQLDSLELAPWANLLQVMIIGETAKRARHNLAEPSYVGDQLNTAASQSNLLRRSVALGPVVEGCIHELFEERVARDPLAIAVTFEGLGLTYDDLNRRANRLAHHLTSLGVGPDVLVALALPRCLEMIVAILAVLKAGGAYVPLDSSYPAERLQFMLADCNPLVLISDSVSLTSVGEISTEMQVIALDRMDFILAELPDVNRHVSNLGLTAQNLAYVIYTSGSTGKPKGVLIQHSNVVRLFTATEGWFAFCAADVWTLFHSYSFDFSVWEIWGALLYGGRLVVVPQTTARIATEFYSLVCREGVTILNQTPSAFRHLTAAQANNPIQHTLRHVIFGGEALDVASLAPWFSQNDDLRTKLVNMYGITETTVHVTYRLLSSTDVASPNKNSVGVPIPDLEIYLMDEFGQLVAPGMSGELYIAGAGLARGYLNRPELTTNRFVPNPYGKTGSRLYRTGDLGRWLPNREIEFLGRIDHQIKLRGFRIELGEIENALMQCIGVHEAVVLLREDNPGDRRLVAYVGGSRDLLSAASLRNTLKRGLPEHMVPAHFVLLEKLPLSVNGKIDRQALPAPEGTRELTESDYFPPRTDTERVVASIWAHVLKIDRVGINDNFFSLGGHSLLATRTVSRIGDHFAVRISVKDLFDTPTVASLAQKIACLSTSTSRLPIVPALRRLPRASS